MNTQYSSYWVAFFTSGDPMFSFNGCSFFEIDRTKLYQFSVQSNKSIYAVNDYGNFYVNGKRITNYSHPKALETLFHVKKARQSFSLDGKSNKGHVVSERIGYTVTDKDVETTYQIVFSREEYKFETKRRELT